MNIKIFGATLTVTLLCLLNHAWAQTYAESAMIFGRTTPGGSARVQGLGSAQIALGGDYSSGLSNPAGLGMFNKSEITFTPGFNSRITTAKYLGNTDEEVKNTLTFPGVSFVFNFPKSDGDFLGGSLGISMTRTNDFNQSFIYHGENPDNSIIDYFISDANGYDESQFDDGDYQYNRPTGLAYRNFLIGPKNLLDPSASNKEYFTDVTTIPDQRENYRTSGSSNQWNFSYGANIKDRLFLGAGLGVTSLRYKSSKTYSEDFPDDDNFNNLKLDENLSIKGSGVNLTIGIIGRPLDFLQLGASYSTPTLYQLTETYDASMSTSWKDFDYYGDGETILGNEYEETDIVRSDYSLVTPSKLSTGIAFISKYGLISADIETINYGGAKYSSAEDEVSYAEDNSDIRSTYKRVFNYRLGGEFRYSLFRARVGYGVQANTYKSSVNDDNMIRNISGGVGIRTKKFFIDFALVFSKGNNTYYPYGGSPVVELTNSLTRGMITTGFTF